jgi:catechol 2,3-dioxygenase-like lactoylglutathione lyase family enzyme
MPLKSLDHVNVRTSRLEEMRSFYRDVLGMREGARPPFSFGGAWMYAGDRPVVHLVQVATPPSYQGELSLEHFAFAAEGLAEFLKKLDEAKVEYRITAPPAAGIKQVNVNDPEGNHIHVDFSAEEPAS